MSDYDTLLFFCYYYFLFFNFFFYIFALTIYKLIETNGKKENRNRI